MIPEQIWKAKLLYDWEGYQAVTAFSSAADLSKYEAFYESVGFVVEKMQDEQECLQFHLTDRDSGIRRFEVLAVKSTGDDDVDDLTSYIGENQYPDDVIERSSSIGALFQLTGE